MPVLEDTHAITAVTMSPTGKYIAICGRTEKKAVLHIYEGLSSQIKKTLPDAYDQEQEYQSKEFVACAFSEKNEKGHLITLTGEPDWQLILWQWDKPKVISKISIGISSPVSTPNSNF